MEKDTFVFTIASMMVRGYVKLRRIRGQYWDAEGHEEREKAGEGEVDSATTESFGG